MARRPPPPRWRPPAPWAVPPRFSTYTQPPAPPRPFAAASRFYGQPRVPPPRGYLPRFVPPPPAVDPETAWLQSFRRTHCNAEHVAAEGAGKEPPLRLLRRRVVQAQELVERLKVAAMELATADKRLEALVAGGKEGLDGENNQRVEMGRLRVQRERKVATCEALKQELEAMHATAGLFPEQQLADIRRFAARVNKKKAYRKRVKQQRRAEASIRRAVDSSKSEKVAPASADKAHDAAQVYGRGPEGGHEDSTEKAPQPAAEHSQPPAMNVSDVAQSAAKPSLDPDTLTFDMLITVRRTWDAYIVYPQTPGASTIPPHFIPPPPHPSAQWAIHIAPHPSTEVTN